MDPNRKKLVIRYVKLFLLLYSIIGLLLYYLQDTILLHPKELPASYTYKFDQPFKEVNIPYRKDVNISIVQFTTPDTPKGVVLYFHGNRDNIERYASQAKMFTSQGYECWMMDYPEFGKSTGSFSEQEVYDWSLTFYKLARAKYTRDSIVIYGRSLGSGVASQLASVRDCKKLILETPYYDIPSLVGHYAPIYPVYRMIKYKFPVHEFLKNVTAPVLILHGNRDWTTPLSKAEKLKKSFKPGDEFVLIEGGGHNDLAKFPEFRKKIEEAL
jgi:alpha-beta hydrolase superfamily lysophospholipase